MLNFNLLLKEKNFFSKNRRRESNYFQSSSSFQFKSKNQRPKTNFRRKKRDTKSNKQRDSYKSYKGTIPNKWLYNLKELFRTFSFQDATRFPSIVKSRDIKNKALCRAIESYAEQNKRAFTWRDIQDYLLTNNGVRIDTNIIRQILKKRLRYSF